MTQNPDRREAALDWLVRTSDPDFDAWDNFTAWLEANPANADEYHRLADSEHRIAPLIEEVPQALPEHRPERRRMAMAACVAVLALGATALLAPGMMPQSYETAAGETRVVSLGGQDRLVMNGGTRLTLGPWDRRDVHLERGQVLLRLNDQKRGVEVFSGDLELVDIGTVFEVSRDGNRTRVLVSEGSVVADPDGAKLQLAAGQRLDTTDGARVLEATPADVAAVGSFARGQLVYVDEPLDRVIADLRRSTGIDFSASPAIGSRRFSGTLSVAEVKRDPESLSPLLGVSIERSDRGWKLGGKV